MKSFEMCPFEANEKKSDSGLLYKKKAKGSIVQWLAKECLMKQVFLLLTFSVFCVHSNSLTDAGNYYWITYNCLGSQVNGRLNHSAV